MPKTAWSDRQAQEMRRRVEQRLADMGNPVPSSLAIRYGLGKDFIRDIRVGRKTWVSHTNLEKLAAALHCDIDYLMLTQDVPRIKKPEEMPVEFGGITEVGVWRAVPPKKRDPRIEDPKLAQVIRTLVDDPIVYIQGDLTMAGAGLGEQAILIAQKRKPKDDDIVILRRTKSGTLQELSTRTAIIKPNRTEYQLAPLAEAHVPDDDVGRCTQEVEAVVIASLQLHA